MERGQKVVVKGHSPGKCHWDAHWIYKRHTWERLPSCAQGTEDAGQGEEEGVCTQCGVLEGGCWGDAGQARGGQTWRLQHIARSASPYLIPAVTSWKA